MSEDTPSSSERVREDALSPTERVREDALSPSERVREDALLHRAIARLRASIMAVVFGLSAGTGLFIATAWLLLKGGPVVGPHLGLLGNYLPGYTVTWPGAFLGFFEAGAAGALVGYAIAFLYNRLVELRLGSRAAETRPG